MEEVYTKTTIKRKVLSLAESVSDRVKGNLHVHVVMDGGFVFGADFIRVCDRKIDKITFLKVSRGYSDGRVHPPQLVGTTPAEYLKGINKANAHIILDVCVERGLTMAFIDGMFTALGITPYRVALVAITRDGLKEVDSFGLLCTKELFLTGYGMGPYRDFGAIYGVKR
jgi:hypoxanthine-guanine phosphoribosyltransferase